LGILLESEDMSDAIDSLEELQTRSKQAFLEDNPATIELDGHSDYRVEEEGGDTYPPYLWRYQTPERAPVFSGRYAVRSVYAVGENRPLGQDLLAPGVYAFVEADEPHQGEPRIEAVWLDGNAISCVAQALGMTSLQ
jgi:hypothetical protein